MTRHLCHISTNPFAHIRHKSLGLQNSKFLTGFTATGCETWFIYVSWKHCHVVVKESFKILTKEKLIDFISMSLFLNFRYGLMREDYERASVNASAPMLSITDRWICQLVTFILILLHCSLIRELLVLMETGQTYSYWDCTANILTTSGIQLETTCLIDISEYI